MPKQRKVFFGRRYPKPLDRPMFFDELGAQVQIAGVIVSGNGTTLGISLPGMSVGAVDAVVHPTIEQWVAILEATDNPEIFELDESGAVKATHRKSQRFVGASLQWEIYRRDAYTCQYCGVSGGVRGTILTVDHFVPVEAGGTDEAHNLITACRKCNRQKGNQSPQEWCESIGLDYEVTRRYLTSPPRYRVS